MTTQPIEAVLDTASARMLFASLAYPAGASARTIFACREEALAWLAELAPRDRVQSALAVRVIALHHATLHHLVRTVQGETAADLALRHSGRATTAARMMDRAMEALQARQVMAPLRAVALPGQIAIAVAERVPAVTEAMAEKDEAVVVEATVDASPPEAPVATPVAAPPASTDAVEPVGSAGYVAKRLQDLEARLARGEELTAAQLEWRRRHVAARTETSDVAFAA